VADQDQTRPASLQSTSHPDRGYPASHLLATYLAPQRARVLALVALLAVTIGLQLANPQILRWFVDDAMVGAPLEQLVQIALLFLVAALALQVASVAEVYVAENVGLTATNLLRADLALHVLRLDPSFHGARTPGELIERTDGDVATLGNFFSRFVVYLVGNALLLLGIIILLVLIDPLVGAAAALCSGLGIGAGLWLRQFGVPRYEAERQTNAELFGLIEERLAGTEDVRANGGVAYVLDRFLERSRAVLGAVLQSSIVGGATFNLGFLTIDLVMATTLAIGAYLYLANAITIGTVYLIFAYGRSLFRPIEAISRQVQDFHRAFASLARVRQLLAERSLVADGPGAELPAGALAVEFDRVTFAYDDGEPVLRDVSFRLEPGQVLGLLGRTGSGKTTVARLLFRLYDPRQGVVRLGGVDLRQPRLDVLRARVGIVTQDIQLFHASVRDNLTFFDRAVPDDRVADVLDELGLGPWLRGLPDGLDTRLAPSGGGLSAGEAQLLAFARVFLKDPGLVILDEASSRLDPATEHLLERAVDRLLAGRTAIVIAHRLATVQRADRILILDNGQVVEEGERAALAANPNSRFGRLLRVGLPEVLA
jgi:ATP-binding cassette, subfamily B, bacterial